MKKLQVKFKKLSTKNFLKSKFQNFQANQITKQQTKWKYYIKKSYMYRVLLKINKITLRIKQDIDIQVAIKKDQSNFVLPKTAKLINCMAELNSQTQFFVNAKQPSIEIYVMLIHQNHKKLVGTLNLDLSTYNLNTNNIIQQHLTHSPDSESSILLQFTYMTTNYTNCAKSLISINQLQYSNIKQMTKQMQTRNDNLMQQNNKLNIQLEALKKDNVNLVNNKNSMQDNYQKCVKNYQQKLENKNLKIMDSQQYMEEMEDKMKRLRELVNNYGNQDIRERVEQIFKY